MVTRLRKIVSWAPVFLVSTWCWAMERQLPLTLPAYVNYPVVDYLAEPPSTSWRGQTFGNVPYGHSWNDFSKEVPRVHQGLLGDPVIITGENESDYKIIVPGAFYGGDEKSGFVNTYWTSKKNLTVLPSSFESPVIKAVAIKPWADQKQGAIFSAGTQFTECREGEDAETGRRYWAVKNVATKLATEKAWLIPQETGCIWELSKKSMVKRFDGIMAVIEGWIDGRAVVPYAIGGLSVLDLFIDPDAFKLARYQSGHEIPDQTSDKTPVQTLGQWERPEGHLPGICTGLDCSNFVLMVYQRLLGIKEYGAKNSAMVEKFMDPLAEDENLQFGDIFQIRGHVMMIASDTHVYEVAGYGSGYGCLHKIAIKDRFKGVSNCAELEKLFRAKQPVVLMNKGWTKESKYDQFKLLSFMSLAKRAQKITVI